MKRHPLQRRRSSMAWRFYRISVRSALLTVAPVLLVCAWYAYRALSEHVRYNAAFGEEQPLTLELFHLHLHDQLRRDSRRLLMPDGPEKSDLPTLNLMLGNGELDQLDRNLPPGEGKGEYVNGWLQKGRRTWNVKVRYRGRKHWHWNYPQKSWKVRLLDGQFFEGRDTINLMNTVNPMPFSEQLVLEIAREQGLLAPDYYPVRLQLNNAPLGVYFLSTQPDEGLLRNNARMPGGLYSGSKAPVNPETGVSSLWDDVSHWKKVATAQDEKLKDVHRLETLLQTVATADQEVFAAFADRHLDLERLATFDALDVVFGTGQHDFHQDHKLYFDPYRARFEPVAWSFGRWRTPSAFNRTENPLLLRLKELPHYRSLRNRKVVELLDGACSPVAIRRRAVGLFRTLAPDQATDPYWDAYMLLPSLSRYFRQMVRPMDLERQLMVFETIMARFKDRVAYLRQELGRPGFDAVVQPAVPRPGAESWRATVRLEVSGHSGYRIDRLEVEPPASCPEGGWTLRADRNLSGVPDEGDLPFEKRRLTLEPGNRTVARPVHPYRGSVRTEPSPRQYRFFVEGPCLPTAVVVQAVRVVDGELLTLRTELAAAADPVVPPVCDRSYRSGPGQESMHPWCHAPAVAQVVELGPGPVDFKEDREFGPHEEVHIRPGTTLRLSNDVSLVFRGKVLAEGTANAPITFTGRKKRYGGIALVGPATEGSRFRYVRFERGRKPSWGIGAFPAMVNIHDTRDVVLEHCTFGFPGKGADDTLHVAYVADLVLKDVTVAFPRSDGIDLEFSSGVLAGVTVIGAGDECLDLMSCHLAVRDSRLMECGGSAISAGEESRLTLVDSYLGKGEQGLLVKNASSVVVDGSLFHRLTTGVRVQVRSDRYDRRSRIRGEALHVLECEQGLVVEGPPRRRDPTVVTPTEDDLERLRSAVLGGTDWSGLDAVTERLRREVVP